MKIGRDKAHPWRIFRMCVYPRIPVHVPYHAVSGELACFCPEPCSMLALRTLHCGEPVDFCAVLTGQGEEPVLVAMVLIVPLNVLRRRWEPEPGLLGADHGEDFTEALGEGASDAISESRVV